ncbi:MAG: flagellar protein [Candidatus Omnitrophica bacterium]|nr:flagellar protein [Candidatus Omnitrophota bacterium]
MADIRPIKNEPVQGIHLNRVIPKEKTSSFQGLSFKEILEEKLGGGLKFSGHALERIQRREIVLDETKLEKLKQAVSMADKKGARSSLILMQDLALIVSIKNKTVITAIDGNHIKENVFTNIDSAIIV